MIPAPYHVQVNYYQYITELAVMIHKYIPYSSYQVKTVNCYQPIPVLLKQFDNYFDAGTASRYFIW